MLEIQTLDAILVRYQTEMSNMSLQNEGKSVLVIKWQRTLLNCVLVFCGRKNCEQWNWILAEGISKEIADGVAWFLLTAKEERRIEEGIVKQKGPRI